MKVFKPKKVFYAMCVYKFTFDTGEYYFGATTDLGTRISSHITKMSGGTSAPNLTTAYQAAKSITFEVVRFVNDREKLKEAEEYYLVKHTGRKKCLNVIAYCNAIFIKGTSAIKIKKERFKKPVTQYDLQMNFIAKFPSMHQAARETHSERKWIRNSINNGKPYKGFIFKFSK